MRIIMKLENKPCEERLKELEACVALRRLEEVYDSTHQIPEKKSTIT